MLKRFKKIFGSLEPEVAELDVVNSRLKLSAAALLVEAALMDENFDETEKIAIKQVLQRQFDLDEKDANSLLNKAEEEQEKSVDVYKFAQSVNKALAPEDREQIIEMLWEVVYADGLLDDYEAALIRKLTGLLHVNDSESAKARQRVLTMKNQKGEKVI